MARPNLGSRARSEVVCVRLTKSEREQLEKVFGKASDGLHGLVMAWLTRQEEK